MISDQGIHVMPSAGNPQPEPGPQCQEWSRPLYDASTTTRNTLERWRQVVHPTGICAGCFGHHPKRFTARGWLIEPHTPSPPKYENCGNPNHTPYPFTSYTQPPCNECADQTDRASWDRGDSVAPDWYANRAADGYGE